MTRSGTGAPGHPGGPDRGMPSATTISACEDTRAASRRSLVAARRMSTFRVTMEPPSPRSMTRRHARRPRSVIAITAQHLPVRKLQGRAWSSSRLAGWAAPREGTSALLSAPGGRTGTQLVRPASGRHSLERADLSRTVSRNGRPSSPEWGRPRRSSLTGVLYRRRPPDDRAHGVDASVRGDVPGQQRNVPRALGRPADEHLDHRGSGSSTRTRPPSTWTVYVQFRATSGSCVTRTVIRSSRSRLRSAPAVPPPRTVQSRGALVDEQYPGGSVQCPRDGYPLPLAPRERPAVLPDGAAVESLDHRPQADLGDHRASRGSAPGPLTRRASRWSGCRRRAGARAAAPSPPAWPSRPRGPRSAGRQR